MTGQISGALATSFSIADIENRAKIDPLVAGFIRKTLATTYAEFLDVLYADLERAISRLEKNPQNYPLDEDEDATTQRLADILFGMTYHVTHNQQAGGNVDITVELPARGFTWIAEAKKFIDVGAMREGYLQLATRYRPGVDAGGVMNGGLIGYLRRKNAVACMTAWRTEFASLDVAVGCTLQDCVRRPKLAFVSEHEHQDFGLPLRIWHTCVVLNFSPQDKSGRTAKRYKSAK